MIQAKGNQNIDAAMHSFLGIILRLYILYTPQLLFKLCAKTYKY